MVYNPSAKTFCFHCGEQVIFKHSYNEHDFCCHGCRSAYQLLKEYHLEGFYKGSDNRGNTITEKLSIEYDYLDSEEICNQLLDYKSEHFAKITFNSPGIHCSSCIWLLENIYKLHEGILNSEVNFLKKEIYLNYDPSKISLKELVIILSKIGYPPEITLQKIYKKSSIKPERAFWLKLGIAGFAFGNVMLFSLPAYFGLDSHKSEHDFDLLFKFLSLAISLPVLFYSASDFLKAAYVSVKNKQITIDVPLCMGILALFGSSVFDILSNHGPGYLDSFTALIFFLLAGRAIQKFSFDKLKFDHDNSELFPLYCLVVVNGKETTKAITELKPEDVVIVRNSELIPGDGILLDKAAIIDYSFVTGENLPHQAYENELLYAGGKLVGKSVKIKLTKPVSKSYLTKLWEYHKDEKEYEEDYQSVVNKRSKYFTYAVLAIAFSAFFFYLFTATFDKALLIFATTLNVSCPCALAVAIPFAYANILKHLSSKGFYLKNSLIVEKITHIDELVFDKTGTITSPNEAEINWHGNELKEEIQTLIKSVCKNSTHPLSQALYSHLKGATFEIEDFIEKVGEGIQAKDKNGKLIKIGSAKFIQQDNSKENGNVFISLDNKFLGHFTFKNKYVDGLDQTLADLKKAYKLYLISGDSDLEKSTIEKQFPHFDRLIFNASPEDKTKFIQSRLQAHKKPMMIGDGLNDTFALKESYIGLAVSHGNGQISPNSDVLVDAKHISDLPKLIKFCKSGMKVIKGGFIFSSIYNAVGLYAAVNGYFSPVFAAILMPLSSVSVVVFSIFYSNINAKNILK